MDSSAKQRIIREAARNGLTAVSWSVHALKRVAQQGFGLADIVASLTSADVIEDYPTTGRHAPDCLALSWIGNRPVHVVVAIMSTDRILVVTVYEPDKERWSDDYTKRL